MLGGEVDRLFKSVNFADDDGLKGESGMLVDVSCEVQQRVEEGELELVFVFSLPVDSGSLLRDHEKGLGHECKQRRLDNRIAAFGICLTVRRIDQQLGVHALNY